MTRDRRPTPNPRRPARLLADERGATAIEYALLASLLAILAIGGLRALGAGTGGLYDALGTVSTAIADALAR